MLKHSQAAIGEAHLDEALERRHIYVYEVQGHAQSERPTGRKQVVSSPGCMQHCTSAGLKDFMLSRIGPFAGSQRAKDGCSAPQQLGDAEISRQQVTDAGKDQTCKARRGVVMATRMDAASHGRPMRCRTLRCQPARQILVTSAQEVVQRTWEDTQQSIAAVSRPAAATEMPAR